MVVALTIGLSVASRTLTDVRISTQSELSQKAFSAAEAGVEDALRQDFKSFTGTGEIQVSSDAKYIVEVTAQGAGTSFAPDRPVEKDDVTQLNLAGTGATALNVYWVDKSDASQSSPKASIEVAEVYLEGGSYKIAKYAANPSCTAIADTGDNNGFSSVGCTSGDFTLGLITYGARLQIPLHSQSQALRIRTFYNRAAAAVEVAAPAGATLPVQSYTISSTGTSGDVVRKVQVSRSVESLPPIFDYVLYSGSGLSK